MYLIFEITFRLLFFFHKMFVSHVCLLLEVLHPLQIYKLYLAWILFFWIRFSAFQERQGGTPLAVILPCQRFYCKNLLQRRERSTVRAYYITTIFLTSVGDFPLQFFFISNTTEMCYCHCYNLKHLHFNPTRPSLSRISVELSLLPVKVSHQELASPLNIARRFHLK